MRQPSMMRADQSSGARAWASALAWFIVFVMIVLLLWVGLQRAGVKFETGAESPRQQSTPVNFASLNVPLPDYTLSEDGSAILRQADFHTVIPDEKAMFTYYTVESGDSITGIARAFHLQPETIFYANYDLLWDNTNNLTIGQQLKIPTTDGVLYKWKKSDTVDKVARSYRAKADDIITWPDNHIDIADPQVPAGAYVMIPGGSRDLIQHVVTTIWRERSGANKTVNPGCDTSQGTYVGSEAFGWPTDNHKLSGNDFWSGHLGVDIAAAQGARVYASDSGVVVYAGGSDGGYGLLVMIDHGNGFHTLYAHNSQIVVGCGQNVGKGAVIAYAGSTGNSTGPHLHFEIRYNGAFVNPWDYLR